LNSNSGDYFVTAERADRRLAAILAADVAGYSLQMGVDEEGTLARLKAVRKAVIVPTLAQHRGRIFKTTGDGMLVEFASAVDAVRGAVDIQRAMAKQNASVPNSKRIEFRIGIHVGDIIFDDNDIFGDGVNIAARLEGIAESGGICVSGAAHDQVRDKLSFPFADLGDRTLKNIARPVRVYGIAAKEMIEPKELQKEEKLAKPVVIFVSGIRGQIGTTTVSKTLVDYWKANQLTFRVFDASGSSNNALGRFFPYTRVVDLTLVDDQMTVFDTIADEPKVTLVEIGSNQLIPTLRTLDRIGFVSAAKSGALDFKCLYVHDDKASGFADVRQFFSDGHFHPVLNEFVSQKSIGEAEARNGTANVVVATLPRQAMATTERESVGYVSFVTNKLPNGESARYSFVLRGYVRHWLAEIWAYYDSIGIWKLPKESN
jgi:class 3 adenylate cyclase